MIELERDAADLEDLAAYLDGRLSAERKAQVAARLLRDEDYYEVFIENVRYQEEQAVAGNARVVAPAAWWRSSKVIAPLAVAATLVAAVSLPRLVLGPPASDWVERLDPAAVTGIAEWDDPGWDRLRGDADPALRRPDLRRQQELAFRIGSHTVDLRIALEAEDSPAAKNAAIQLEKRAFETMVLMAAADYGELKVQIDDRDFDLLRTRAAELEEYLAEEAFEGTPATRYALGTWNEAGRLAALTENAEVLAGIWRRRRVAQGIGEIEGHLEALETVVEQPEPDFEAAAAAFSEIATALAGRG